MASFESPTIGSPGFNPQPYWSFMGENMGEPLGLLAAPPKSRIRGDPLGIAGSSEVRVGAQGESRAADSGPQVAVLKMGPECALSKKLPMAGNDLYNLFYSILW